MTHLVQALVPTHSAFDVTVRTCPAAGCFPPPPPPAPPPPENYFIPWSSASAWMNLTDHAANPLNTVTYASLKDKDGSLRATVVSAQAWSGPVPGAYDNVWIPPWRKVILDVNTPLLGHVIVEGVLLVNGTSSVALSATYFEVRNPCVVYFPLLRLLLCVKRMLICSHEYILHAYISVCKYEIRILTHIHTSMCTYLADTWRITHHCTNGRKRHYHWRLHR